MNAAVAMQVLSREHGLALQSIYAEMILGWARGRLYSAEAGAEELKQWLGEYGKLGVIVHAPFVHALLAELELEALGAETALARIEEGLAIAQRTGIRCDLAFLHRLRGDVLLRRDPSDRSGAEDAYRAAIAIAKEQGARSYELLASLALAKLLPIDRPPGRSPRHPRAGARRFCADARDARDRRGAGAARGAGGDR